MYAPVVLRFQTYEPNLSETAAAYCEALASWPAMLEWVAAAHQEASRIAQYEKQPSELEVPPLRFLGDARLMQAQPAMATSDVGTDACREMVATLKRAMSRYGGIGIAAPQIGLWTRAFVFGIEGSNPRYAAAPPIPFQVWINPRIVWSSEEVSYMWEGCLSVPGLRGWVERPRAVRLRGLDESGAEREVELDGLAARIAQHELDHLDGVLFPHRSPSTRFIVPQASMDVQDEWGEHWPSAGSRQTALGELSDAM
eukprot:780328-Prymnesium_polylepis.1